jgi:Glycosyl hydrolase family 26
MRGLVAVVLALVLAPAAHARPLLGLFGGQARFQQLTGQQTQVGHALFGWGQSSFDQVLPRLGTAPMIALVEGPITPLAIAQGRGDDYLFALNSSLSRWARPAYVRPLPEMNGHWNSYCAYTKSGRSKGAAYSTAAFRKAFARIYLIVHGGPAATINARLAALKLPPISRDLPENPLPRVKVMWNPQGYGSPDLPGNSAQAYYPGDRYVDVVGNDLYFIRGKAEWAAAERLYKAHPSKPYAFAEWGLWGIDDPSFITRMAQFARSHARLEVLAWYNGQRGGVFDIGTKPRARAAYRRLIVPLGA